MSRQLNDIRMQFEQKLGEAGSGTFYATVKSVDEQQRTCTVEVGNITYPDVLLYSVEDAELEGFVALPAVESIVLVSRVGGGSRLFVEMVSVIDKVLLTIGGNVSGVVDAAGVEFTAGESVFKATEAGFVINRGNYGLLQTLKDLIDAIMKLTVPTGTGPSGVPINIASFTKILGELNEYLEE